MGMIQAARETNATKKLIAAVEVNLLPTGYFEILGACGHRLTVVNKTSAELWRERIANRSRFRKRCYYCDK